MIPIKEFKVDFNPQQTKKDQKQKVKIDPKKKRPITGKVAALVEDSKSKLQKMMKLNKQTIADKVEKKEKVQRPQTSKIQSSQQQPQTQVQFNVDVFLKTQKQKQKQYAKDLQKQFQNSKKQRMDKLYKRQKQANQKIAQTKIQTKTKHKFYDELPTLIRYPVQQTNQLIIQSHQVSKIKEFISFVSVNQIREDQEKIFDKKYKWEKAQKLCQDVTKLKFVEIKDDEIKIKNELVVCGDSDNLLSVLALISTKPSLLERITLYKQKMITQKVYPFLFFKNNKRLTVVVDNYLQCEQLQFEQVLMSSHYKNKNIIWISLFQKAYKKLFREVGTIHEVTNNILNVAPQIIKISEKAIIKQNLFQALRFHLRNGAVIGLFRKGAMAKATSYQGRVYPIKEVRIGKTLEQSSIKVINPWNGKSLLSHGKQFLNYEQLLSQFNRIIIIKDYPLNFTGTQLNINMYSFGLPASNNPEWVKNNQYLINVNKPSNFRFILRRTNFYADIYGFMLLRCDSDDTKIVAINLDKLVVTVRSTLANQASFAENLDKGSYILLPFTHQRSQESYVFLKLQIYTSSTDNYTFSKSKIVDVEYKQIRKLDDKIEGDLDVTEKFQRPKPKLLLQKGEKHLLPDQLSSKDIPNFAIQNPSIKLQDIFIPGFSHRFIVKQNVIVQQKQTNQKQKINQKQESSEPNPEVLLNARNEELKVLLGIDAYTDQVDKEMMEQALGHLEEEVDFANYQLQDQGFQKILQHIMEQPRIVVLNLKNNKLSDKSIVLLCYYLEKGNHTELRKLNLSDNLISGIGFKALEGLSKRMKLKQIILTGNTGLKIQQIKSLSKIQVS